MYIHSYVYAIKLSYYRMKTLCNTILSKTGNMNNKLSSVTIAMQAMFAMTYSVSTKHLLEKQNYNYHHWIFLCWFRCIGDKLVAYVWSH